MKRGGYIKRHTELRRSRWGIKPKPPRRLSLTVEEGNDPEYRARVSTLWCRARTIPGHDHCWGPIDPHHAGKREPGSKSTKAHDHTCIPMCRKHHDAVEELTGMFKPWDKARRRAWYVEQIAWTQARIGLVKEAA